MLWEWNLLNYWLYYVFVCLYYWMGGKNVWNKRYKIIVIVFIKMLMEDISNFIDLVMLKFGVLWLIVIILC